MKPDQNLAKIMANLYDAGKDVKFTKLPSGAKRSRKSMMIKNHTGKGVTRRMGNFM